MPGLRPDIGQAISAGLWRNPDLPGSILETFDPCHCSSSRNILRRQPCVGAKTAQLCGEPPPSHARRTSHAAPPSCVSGQFACSRSLHPGASCSKIITQTTRPQSMARPGPRSAPASARPRQGGRLCPRRESGTLRMRPAIRRLSPRRVSLPPLQSQRAGSPASGLTCGEGIFAGGASWRLPADASCAWTARAHVRQALADLQLPGTLIDDAAIAVSELATNAWLHAGTPSRHPRRRELAPSRRSCGSTGAGIRRAPRSSAGSSMRAAAPCPGHGRIRSGCSRIARNWPIRSWTRSLRALREADTAWALSRPIR